MRVLMVAPQPFREPRGTPISTYQRLRGLSDLGHTVDIVTYPLGEDVAIPGVRIFRTARVPFIKQVRIGPSAAKLVLDFLLFWKVVTLLSRNRYDVIHSHEEAAFFCALLSALFRTPHLYDMHSSLPRQLVNFGFGSRSPVVKLFGLLERLTVERCHAVITIGPDLEKHVEEMRPAVPLIRIDNMPVQIMSDPPRDGAAEELRGRLGLRGKTPVVYIGTLESYQGIDLLLDSATIVSGSDSSVAFIVVGGRPQQVEHWRREADIRGMDGCIQFVGSVPLEETAAYMEMAEILVSPRTGGISVPLKIYSYLLSGKPIVATNVPTHTLVLDESTSLLAEPTGEGLAEGILRLVDQPALRRQLGSNGRELAKERYSWEGYLERLATIYGSLQPAGGSPVIEVRGQDTGRAQEREQEATGALPGDNRAA
jgi:glycosyltransferase involved in cell wall biosynthesis